MALLTPKTGSIIDNNGQDSTRTQISTNIVIQIDGTSVGAVQNLTVREQRQIQTIDEVGTDGHIDSVPIKSTDITCDCSRINFDLLYLPTAFSRGFLHIGSQRIPFDIVILDQWAGDGDSTIITTIRNCWFTSLSQSYRADNFMVVQDASMTAESIFSSLPSGGSAASSGPRGFNLRINSVEQEADVGKRRGGLDIGNIIGAVFQ